MTPERAKEVRLLAEKVADLDPSARRERLVELAHGDLSLVEDVLGIFAAAEKGDSFLEPNSEISYASVVPEEPTIGLRLGDFELVEEIGDGGMGVVFKARQHALNRFVALKTLRPVWTIDAGAVRRFHDEAKRIAAFDHPGIARVHLVDSQNGIHFIAMEFVDGRDLHEELEGARGVDGKRSHVLPARTAENYDRVVARIIRDVASALACAHGQGIVHRDVKPRNIVLTSGGQPKLVDFGIARDISYGAVVATTAAFGTPHYMSPEQVDRAESGIDERTDIFSLGVVLYEMLTLVRPFDGPTLPDIFREIERADPPAIRSLRPEVPAALVAICEKAIEKDRTKRFASAKAMAEHLDAFLEGRDVLLRPRTPIERLGRRIVREKTKVLLSVAGLLGIAVMLLAIFGDFRGGPKIEIEVVRQGSDEPVPGRLILRLLRAETGEIGEPVELGANPAVDVPIAEGFYRITFVAENGDFREYGRWIEGFDDRLRKKLRLVFRDQRASPRPELREFAGVAALKMPFSGHDGCKIEYESVAVAPFFIGVHEVSNAEYLEFVRDTGHRPPQIFEVLPYRSEWDDLPVVGIGWEEAQAYCEWRGYRLPTHAEWELAARGEEGRKFPWGNDLPLRGNVGRSMDWTADTSLIDCYRIYVSAARPVRRQSLGIESEARTPQFVCDLFGNVGEWVESTFFEQRDLIPTRDSLRRYALGHSWAAGGVSAPDLSVHGFFHKEDQGRRIDTGFRIAASAQP